MKHLPFTRHSGHTCFKTDETIKKKFFRAPQTSITDFFSQRSQQIRPLRAISDPGYDKNWRHEINFFSHNLKISPANLSFWLDVRISGYFIAHSLSKKFCIYANSLFSIASIRHLNIQQRYRGRAVFVMEYLDCLCQPPPKLFLQSLNRK